MIAKYIIYRKDGLELPIVFSKFESHSDIAQKLQLNVVSAGFCSVQSGLTRNTEYRAWGIASSLKIRSRAEDSAILTEYLIES